jgi:hypothetical protein
MTKVLFLVIATSILYSLQWIIYTKYARKYDGLRVVQVRNIVMILTWIPLLFFVPNISLTEIFVYWPWIVLTAIVWAFHVYISYKSYTYIPLGIAQVVKKSVKSLIVLAISVLVLHELFTFWQVRWLSLITLGAIRLWSQKIDISHLDMQDAPLGFFYVVLAWIASWCSWYFFTKYANNLNSLLAAYILEMSIWVMYLIQGIFSSYLWSSSGFIQQLLAINKKDLLWMSMTTFVAFWWTICMALAFKVWSFGYSGLLTIMWVPISFVLALCMFKEKITRTQAAAICIILVGLRVV